MKQYIVDAFTDTLFHGNQAAICILDEWLPEDLMMNITRENNFSETAFAVPEGNCYHLRWFTRAERLIYADMLRSPALMSSLKNISHRKRLSRLPRSVAN